MILGAGASRPVHPNQLLGIELFVNTKPYPIGKYILHENGFYVFTSAHSAGDWNENEVHKISTLDLILQCLGDPRIKPISTTTLVEGDMLFYDRAKMEYCVVAKEMISAVLADFNTTRYETNYDTYIGTVGGKAHFVARADAAPSQSVYSNDVAATSCFYRIEVEVGTAGSITFSAASGNASIASNTITWSASNTLAEIVALFTAKNTTYITFAKLADDKGVGLEIGGYGANTLTVTASSNCTIIDCSMLSFYRSKNPGAPAVGSTLNPNAALTYIKPNTHINWRGAAAATCLPNQNLIGASSSWIGNDGFDYSYRTGLNFARFKAWASASGESTYYDDGEGGTDQSVGHVMSKAEFDTDVTNYTGSDSHHTGMKTYYTHLFSDQTGEYAELRQLYESRYGQMTDMYDAYLMSHMSKVDANSGIVNSMRNQGKHQTEVKADAMNVNYNYVVIPAYPPEYNAVHYGIAASEGFTPGVYYHPEPADLTLFLRDDILALVNANITASGGGNVIPTAAGNYRGSCAYYSAYNTWYFIGDYGIANVSNRYGGSFRCRPVLALSLS